MYRVIQHRWIRGSEQNFPNEVWSGTRIKEARGQCKQLIRSHAEMVYLKHNFYPEAEFEIDLDTYYLQFTDEKGVLYSCQYKIVEEG